MATQGLPAVSPPFARLAILGHALIWLTAFSGAIVLREPAPYEFIAILAIVLLFGPGRLTVSRRTLPMIVLLVLFILGGMAGALQGSDLAATSLYMAVTAFLVATAMLFASHVAREPERGAAAILSGYAFGALVAVTCAVVGYFGLLPGSEIFTRYGRASGTFQDPNVLATFLLLPAAAALYEVLVGDFRRTMFSSFLVLVCAVGIFLTFSRAGWGMFALLAMIVTILTYALNGSLKIRARIVILTVIGTALLAGLLAVALNLPAIRELFEIRANLDQSYDLGPLGRFGRQLSGIVIALQNPLGIGPLEFARKFPEDPHNVYLNAFLSYGWLGGFSYLMLVVLTLSRLARCTLEKGRYQRFLVPVFSTFLVIALEGMIIDTDHWRHFYLLVGLSWGLMAAHERDRHQRRCAAADMAPDPTASPSRQVRPASAH